MSKFLQSIKVNIGQCFHKIQFADVYKFIICLLFFLFGLNLFTYGPYFLMAIIFITSIKAIILKEFKINSGLIVTMGFSILFYAFRILNYGLVAKEMVYYLLGPIGLFVAGQNLVVTFKNKERAMYLILMITGFGFSLHAFLNMVNRIFEFGLNADNRIAPDIWNGQYISATGIGMLFPIACSFLFPILFIKNKDKRWYDYVIVIFSFVVSFYTTMVLANRTMLFIVLITFYVGLMTVSILSIKKKKWPLFALIIVSLILVAFYVVVKKDLFNVSKILSKIPLFDRIFNDYDGSMLSSERFEIYKAFFKHWLHYPFGGEKIPLGISNYCHNVWLDIYNIGGVFPFLAFIILTIALIKRIIDVFVLSKDLYFRITVISFFASIVLLFLVEPIIQGNIYIYLVIFLFFGFIDTISIEYKFAYRKVYNKTFSNLASCKVVFISNYLSIHQIEFCKAMSAKFKGNFKFIATVPFPNERVKLGCTSKVGVDCVIEMFKDKQSGLKALEEADVIIYGNADDRKLIYPQLKKGKLVFKISERLYKSGKWYEPYKIRSIISQYLHYKRYQPYNMYYLCNSGYTTYDLSIFGINPNRCFKLGYLTLDNEYDDFETLYQKKAKNNRVEILFVNRLIKLKHPEKCIVVAKYLKSKNVPFRMRIVGIGDKKIEEQLEKDIYDNGLENSVKLLGALENEKVRALMEYSNIVLATSDYGEGWGACVNEGMQSGCVVVASHSHGSVPFLIKNNVNGIVYQLDDDKELCEQVERIAKNRDLQYQLGKAAFEQMKGEWSANEVVTRFSELVMAISNNEDLDIYEDGPISHSKVINHDWYKSEKNNKETVTKENVVKKEKSSGRIRSGAIVSYLTIIFNIVAGLIYTPWMISTIGSDNYSIYTLCTSIIGMLAVDFGLGRAVSRYLSKYQAEKDPVMANKFLGIAFKLFLFIDGIIFLGLLIVFFLINTLYGKTYNPEQLHTLKIVFVMVGFYSLISFGTRPINGVLISNERFSFHKGVDFFQKVLTITLVVVSLALGYDLYAVVLANCASGLLAILIRYIYIKKHLNFKPNLKYRDKPLTKSIFMFSIWTTVLTLSQKIIISVTPSIISVMNTNAIQITVWSVGLMVEEYSWLLSDALNGLFLPKLSKMEANNTTPHQFTTFMILIGRIQLLISGLIIIGYCAIGQGFMKLWMERGLKGNYEQAFVVGLFLLLPYIVLFTQQIGKTLLVVQNKVKYHAYCSIVTAVISFVLSVLLAKPLGAIGCAIGICVGRVVGYIILLNYMFKKKLELEIGRFFKETHLRFAIPMLVVLGVGITLEIIMPTTGWTVFIFKGFIIVILYVVIMWLFVLRNEEKEIINNIISPIKKVLSRVNERG